MSRRFLDSATVVGIVGKLGKLSILKKLLPETDMSIDACIAHAIHSDLDILVANPELKMLKDIDNFEVEIERYIRGLHECIKENIDSWGKKHVKSGDAAGLCAVLLHEGIDIPPNMLFNMCKTICEMSKMDARFIADTDDGTEIYYIHLTI